MNWLDGYGFLEMVYPASARAIELAAKSIALLAVAAAMAWLLRRRSAEARNAVWRAALAGLLLLALWTAVPATFWHPVTYRPFDGIIRAQTAAVHAGMMRNMDEVMRRQEEARAALPPEQAPPPWEPKSAPVRIPDLRTAPWAQIETALPAAWAAGAMLLAGWRLGGLGLAAFRLRRRRRPASPEAGALAAEISAHLGLRRVPPVYWTDAVATPLLFGPFRPAVYLPDWVDAIPAELAAILGHELAHARRRDTAWQFLGSLVQAVWWWNPLALLAQLRMRAEAEQCADNLAVAGQWAPADYAEWLLYLAGQAGNGPRMAGAVPMFSRFPLRRRVEALLADNRWRGKAGAWGIGLALVCVLLAGGWGGWRMALGSPMPPAQAPAQPPADWKPLTPHQREILTRARDGAIARQKALRFFHLLTENRPAEMPAEMASGRTEAWVDGWGSRFRAEYKPRVSRWIQGPPGQNYYVANQLEIGDGRKTYTIDLDQGPAGFAKPRVSERPFAFYSGLDFEQETLLIQSLRNLLQIDTPSQNFRQSVEETEWEGAPAVRIVEEFRDARGVPTQRTVYLLDSAHGYALRRYELIFPKAGRTGLIVDVGEFRALPDGMVYPAFVTRTDAQQEDGQWVQKINTTKVLTLEPLPVLPPEALRLPEKPAGLVAPAGEEKQPAAMDIRVVDAARGAAVSGGTLKVAINRQPEQRLAIGADGTATVALPAEEVTYLHILANEPSHAIHSTTWRKTGDRLRFPAAFTIALQPGAPISGRVVDETGAPVAGAQVYILQGLSGPSPSFLSLPLQGGVTATSDAEGRWKLEQFPPDLSRLLVRVSHPDFQATTDSGVGDYRQLTGQDYASLRNGSSRIVLKRGETVQGTVADAEGRPVANAQITLGEDRWGSNPPTTKTGADGGFVLRNMVAGPNVVTVEAAGCKPRALDITIPLAQPLAVRLEPGRRIAVRVVDPQGKPVEGLYAQADTWVQKRKPRDLRTLQFAAPTDAEGRLVWDGAPDETVTFVLGGCGNGKPHDQVLIDYPLSPRDGEQIVVMKPSLAVQGRIVDAADKPVPNVRVTPGLVFASQPDRSIWQDEQAKSAPGGTYEWKSSRMGVSYRFRVEAPGFVTQETEAFPADQREREWTVKLVPAPATTASATPSPSSPR